MIKPQNQPNNIPLIVLLIGTTILAIPAVFGTFALLETSSGPGISLNDFPGKILFLISIGGFLLFAGYILTACFRRHSSIFWFFSMFYNFALGGCYWYLIFKSLLDSPKNFNVDIFGIILLLVPLWTVFVSISSAYYFKFALFNKNSHYL